MLTALDAERERVPGILVLVFGLFGLLLADRGLPSPTPIFRTLGCLMSFMLSSRTLACLDVETLPGEVGPAAGPVTPWVAAPLALLPVTLALTCREVPIILALTCREVDLLEGCAAAPRGDNWARRDTSSSANCWLGCLLAPRLAVKSLPWLPMTSRAYRPGLNVPSARASVMYTFPPARSSFDRENVGELLCGRISPLVDRSFASFFP